MVANLGYYISCAWWDYFVLSIKVTPNHGVALINLLCKFTNKGHFYPKKNSRSYRILLGYYPKLGMDIIVS